MTTHHQPRNHQTTRRSALRSRKGVLSLAAAATGGALALGLTPVGPAVANTLIGSAQIRDNSVQSRDIRDNTIRQHDLASPLRNRINNAAARAAVPGPRGAQGPAGATGAQGPRGAQGADGVSGYQVINHYTRNNGTDLGVALAPGETRKMVATCPEGLVPLSGGFSNGNTTAGWDLIIHESVPAGFDRDTASATGWSVTATNPTSVAQHAQISMVCAQVD
jgi:hypothetical protein